MKTHRSRTHDGWAGWLMASLCLYAALPGAKAQPPAATPIKRLVIIYQENRSFTITTAPSPGPMEFWTPTAKSNRNW